MKVITHRFNRLPFSPLTVTALVESAIHAAAFGRDDGYVAAYELADAIAIRQGERLSFDARSIDVGRRLPR